MIYSMTAFARQEGFGDWGSATWEIRSINHRYLELTVRLPEILTELESAIRDKLRQKLHRGKVECILRYQVANTETGKLTVNMHLVQQLIAASQAIQKMLSSATSLSIMELLRWPGVTRMVEASSSSVQESVVTLFDNALDDLIIARGREGNALADLIKERNLAMENEIGKVKVRLPSILKAQRERLLSRLTEAKIDLDPARIEQEMLLFAQKIDVSEELDRLQTHVKELKHIFQQGGAIGRRLDFLLQELNREANTLAAKSADSETTRAAVELKVLIEQIREQIQNLE